MLFVMLRGPVQIRVASDGRGGMTLEVVDAGDLFVAIHHAAEHQRKWAWLIYRLAALRLYRCDAIRERKRGKSATARRRVFVGLIGFWQVVQFMDSMPRRKVAPEASR
jgi:hypothetical protein